jgi:hypothetical protein
MERKIKEIMRVPLKIEVKNIKIFIRIYQKMYKIETRHNLNYNKIKESLLSLFRRIHCLKVLLSERNLFLHLKRHKNNRVLK